MVHPSIIKHGGQFEVKSSNVNRTLFHCLLCPKFKLTTSRRIQRHMESHINTALHVEGNIICRCNQPCRPTGHYHCPYCGRTILRKEHMETHVYGCQCKPAQTVPSPSMTSVALASPSTTLTVSSSPLMTLAAFTSLPTTSSPMTLAVPQSPTVPAIQLPLSPTLGVPRPPSGISAVHASPPVTSAAPSSCLTLAAPPSPPTLTVPPITLAVPSPVTPVVPSSSFSSILVSPPSPAVTSAVLNPEPHPAIPEFMEEPMECQASVVDQDHCYTLPFPVSRHSPVASPTSSDIVSASQPEASSTGACSPEASLRTGKVSDGIMKLPSYGVIRLKLARCRHCSLRLYKKNLRAHIQRKHGGFKDITAASHLKNVCVDETRGIFAVQKVAHGFSVPIHVQRKTWGNPHQIKCGLEECHKYQLLAKKSGLIYSLCEHIRSLDYCSKVAPEEFLREAVLEELVSMHVMEESMMAICKMRQKAAEKDHVPFSVLVDLGGSTHQICFSVHEPKNLSFSCFGRAIVIYNLKKQSWHCPCTNSRETCPHKSIGKWHLFQTRRDLLPASTEETSHTYVHQSTIGWERSVRYTFAHKKIPVPLPGDTTAPRALTDYPVCLIPTEETCKLCQGHPRLEEGFLFTDKAVIVGMSGVQHNISTFNKRCPDCNMDYRYQEWRDGLHNFNDHVILTLELCLYMRHGLQCHMSVSRMISSLESFRGQRFPAVSIIFQAYCHFEALTDTEYSYTCYSCGFFPPVVIMDIHRSRISKLEVSELKTPPEHFDGQHNAEVFWDSVQLEMISRGFFPTCSKNPFEVHPCYTHWAPWIGKETRKSDGLLNTEFKKMLASETEGEEATLQTLCKKCGVNTSGSRTDLIIRLMEKLTDQQTCVDVYKSICSASGGWSVVACPHGIVYSLKFNLHIGTPRDFADLLLSWKHFPNVCLYDSACALATHTNSRVPHNPPFYPHDGKLVAPTQENLAQAVCRKLKVPLLWLKENHEHLQQNGHPVTGSSHHYALYNKLHEINAKDPDDVLRGADLVPELQDALKSKGVKLLFADMRKNNYFLNSMSASTHVFLMRNLIEHRNTFCNQKRLDN
ncbi:uncharacterized protein LOC113156781 isoform X2 [Anabas testudineus]|uniref:uncharacterized protein LOC113156781 isoform X2 n=1 Tax=Anabas testudineus TaxID=64144 RepID=UPI000E465467|nr:uncharacterized protein LOC113156781 isoform X2 [Anabas testudineus]